MKVRQIDPLLDNRWPDFLESDRRASVFHTRGWLQALRQTYNYQPIVFTTAEAGQKLTNGWVFCGVNSWITGKRLVSLPFSDHCDPLTETPEQLLALKSSLTTSHPGHGWNYIECRPLNDEIGFDPFQKAASYCFHKLDLVPDLSDLFRFLHKDSTQRKIRRAERESISFSEGCSSELLDHFYHLMVLTRRRHKRFPQPRKWFSILAACLGDDLKVRVAYFKRAPIAAILTLRFKKQLIYKYGCADDRYFPLGGMQALLWRAIDDAKQSGLRDFDLGRSDLSNRGLIVFKNRLGAGRSALNYFRFPAESESKALRSAAEKQLEKCVRFTPTPILIGAGTLLYKHFG